MASRKHFQQRPVLAPPAGGPGEGAQGKLQVPCGGTAAGRSDGLGAVEKRGPGQFFPQEGAGLFFVLAGVAAEGASRGRGRPEQTAVLGFARRFQRRVAESVGACALDQAASEFGLLGVGEQRLPVLRRRALGRPGALIQTVDELGTRQPGPVVRQAIRRGE